MSNEKIVYSKEERRRKADMFLRVMHGAKYKTVAEEHGLKVPTVREHCIRLYEAMQVPGSAEYDVLMLRRYWCPAATVQVVMWANGDGGELNFDAIYDWCGEKRVYPTTQKEPWYIKLLTWVVTKIWGAK
jgi:hypothetical protein